MDKKIKVSFIIAAYNAEKYIEEAVDSCFNQKAINNVAIEVVITNDGSTDKTLDILNSLREKYKNLKIASFSTNKGKVSAFNKSFKKSTGNYIAIMSADDISTGDRVITSIDALEKHKADLVFGKTRTFSNHKKINNSSSFTKDIQKEYQQYGINEFSVKQVVAGGTIFAKRELMEKIFPIPDYFVSEDLWIPIKSSSLGKVISINKILLHYRIHESNSSLNLINSDILYDFSNWTRFYSRHEKIYKKILESIEMSAFAKKHFNLRHAQQKAVHSSLNTRLRLLLHNLPTLFLSKTYPVHKKIYIFILFTSPKLAWHIYILIHRNGR